MSALNRVTKCIDWLIFERKVKSRRDLAEKMGYTESSMSQILNSRVALSDKFIKKLSNVDSNVSEVWLLKGEGKMLRQEKTNEELSYLPLIPVDAIAGFGSDDIIGISVVDCQQYAIPEFSAIGAEFLIRVSGSSMYPKYSNGDILACKKVKDMLFFQWGKVYVLDSSQGALVKRIFEDNNNPKNIMCVSENSEKYPPFIMPKTDIRSVSIVIGAIKTE